MQNERNGAQKIRTYEIINELNGEKIRVSGISIRECQSKAARKIRNNGWANEDIYHSDRIEPKGLIARIISRIGEK